MRRFAAVLFLLLTLATNAWAFRGRPVSGLRFEGYAAPYHHTKIASDGTDFLILSAVFQFPMHVFTQKVVNGRPVGPHRQIADGQPVNLLWTGTDYLAGWSTDDALWVTPVSREGSPRSIPAEPVLHGDSFTLAGNGAAVLALARTKSQLTALPLNAAGQPAGNANSYSLPGTFGFVAAGPAGNGFAFVLSNTDGKWLMLFRADGSAITNAPVLLDGAGWSGAAHVATDGTDTLVAFTNGQPAVGTELKSVVVGPDGNVKATHVLHAVAGQAELISANGLVWDGTQYVAAMTAERNPPFGFQFDPALLRVASDGQRIGEPEWLTTDPGIQSVLALGRNGRELLVAMESGSGPTCVTVNPSTLRPNAPARLARTVSSQSGIAIAPGPNGHLAAWLERGALRASRIDAAGNPLDDEGIVLAEPAAGALISIDGSGPQWLVVWSDTGNIRARFVSRGGTPTAGPFVIGPGYGAAVQWDGSRYIVLRQRDGSIFSNTLSPSGSVGPEQTVAASEQLSEKTSVEYDRPFVVMLRRRPLALFRKYIFDCTWGHCQQGTASLFGLRLDAPEATPFQISSDYVSEEFTVATSDEQLLVLWHGGAGVLLDSDAPEQGGTTFDFEEQGAAPAAAFDGTAFFVASWKFDPPTKHWNLLTMRIFPDGARSDRTLVRVDGAGAAVSASATLAPLIAFSQAPAEYHSVRRVSLLLASELDEAPAPPAAPSIVCATPNADGTITVRWQPVANALGISVEIRLPDGTFREIGVAPGAETSAHVSTGGLEGDAVRVRAWNAGGLSQPSAIAPALPAPSATLRSSFRACAGTPATINITLSGAPPFTIRWDDGFVQSNVTTFTATRTVTVTRDTTFSIVSVADASCAINEMPESVRITADPLPAIQEQPREVRIASGQTATLTVPATHATQYAWFEGPRGNTSRPVGSNSASFTTPALTQTTQYWVRVSNRCGSVDSNAMTVVVSGKRRSARR